MFADGAASLSLVGHGPARAALKRSVGSFVSGIRIVDEHRGADIWVQLDQVELPAFAYEGAGLVFGRDNLDSLEAMLRARPTTLSRYSAAATDIR